MKTTALLTPDHAACKQFAPAINKRSSLEDLRSEDPSAYPSWSDLQKDKQKQNLACMIHAVCLLYTITITNRLCAWRRNMPPPPAS